MERIKLFCLPYAGGSAAIYYKWRGFLNGHIALYPVELAGRGKRIRTPLYNDLKEAVEDICSIIGPETDGGPYALFGHSMGSLLAFETIYRLEQMGKKSPIHAFFSGRCAPCIAEKSKILHVLPDGQFKEEILKMGGTDSEVFENEELSGFFIPLLKSDFKIVETYRYAEKGEKLKTDITVLSGKADSIAVHEDIAGWRQHTAGNCEIYEFEGGHFFINSCVKDIADIINHTLTEEYKAVTGAGQVLQE